MRIPPDEFRFSFSRSGGPGGQNVNKVESRVELRWDLWRSRAFSDGDKIRLAIALAPRMTKEGEVQLTSSTTRSQDQNRALAIERLEELVKDALRPVKKRRPTKPTRASKERRLEGKKKLSEKKRLRREGE